MVRNKEVPALRHFCLKALPKLISSHIRTVARRARAMKWYALFSGAEEDNSREAILRRQADLLRTHVYENVVWYDHEDVFQAVLDGVEEALCKTRRNWRPDCDMALYRQELEALSFFTEVVLFSQLRKMDFSRVPKSLRTRITDNFGVFSNLRSLSLGSSGAGGQWLFRGTVARSVAKGMAQMTRLETFSCKYDCTPEMLQVLSNTCPDTLRALDVEGSKAVDDKCLGSILALSNLEELHLFNTKLSDEAGARILLGLRKLTNLIRADFLCESLGWIDYLGEAEDGLQLLITEFFPSQKYYFHEEWQMEMVSRLCPYISKMFFIFHETCVPDFTVLAGFEFLTDLCLFGGDFYLDKLNSLLEVRGRQLLSLCLMSVFKVNLLAVALISVNCADLRCLRLVNCDAGEPRRDGDDQAAFLRMSMTADATAGDLKHLEELTLHSRCRRSYLSFLLRRCPRVQRIDLGSSCEVDDETLVTAAETGLLSSLTEFHCESSSSSSLTVSAARALTSSACPELRALGDLQSWRGADPAEVGAFRQRCYDRNLALDTRSHRRLRQRLELRDSERRSRFNLMAGPTVERIRLAERDRRGQPEQDEE